MRKMKEIKTRRRRGVKALKKKKKTAVIRDVKHEERLSDSESQTGSLNSFPRSFKT